MTPMKPSAEERADALRLVGPSLHGATINRTDAVNALRLAYRDGFLAAVALLREPSEAILALVEAAIENAENGPGFVLEGYAVCRDLAVKLAEAAGESGATEPEPEAPLHPAAR